MLRTEAHFNDPSRNSPENWPATQELQRPRKAEGFGAAQNSVWCAGPGFSGVPGGWDLGRQPRMLFASHGESRPLLGQFRRHLSAAGPSCRVNTVAPFDQIQQARETLEKLLTVLQSAPIERDRICFPPLSVPEGVSANVRNCWEIRQADRAVRHRNLPGSREHGLQGRISAAGAPAPAERINGLYE